MPLNLSFLPFLNRIEKSVLDAVEHEVEWFCLPAGKLLFREGDDADAFYLVRSGALAAFRDGALGRPDLIGYIRAGEPVGEMSLLDETPLTTPSDAPGHTLVDVHPQLPLLNYYRDAPCGDDKISFGAVTRIGTIAGILALVLRGDGVAVLPAYFVRPYLETDQLRVVLSDTALLTDRFRLIFRRDDPRRAVYESLANTMLATPLA